MCCTIMVTPTKFSCIIRFQLCLAPVIHKPSIIVAQSAATLQVSVDNLFCLHEFEETI